MVGKIRKSSVDIPVKYSDQSVTEGRGRNELPRNRCSGVFESLGRSWQLTRSLCGKIFVGWVLTMLLVYNAILLIQGPFLAAVFWYTFKVGAMPFWLTAASAVAAAVSNILSGPFVVLVIALFYYDARVRKEALDLRLLLARAEGEAQPQQPSSPSPVSGALLG